jgi:hypothetical protein
MKAPPDPHHRHRFLAEIISHVVWPPLVLRGQLESFGGRPLISASSALMATGGGVPDISHSLGITS